MYSVRKQYQQRPTHRPVSTALETAQVFKRSDLIPEFRRGAAIVRVLAAQASEPKLGARIASKLAISDLPVHRVTAPGFLHFIRSSDHWSFWKCGYRAVMITDAAPFRYRHYHRETDTTEHIDYERLALVSRAVRSVVMDLARVDRS